jgi:hypothetical protein
MKEYRIWLKEIINAKKILISSQFPSPGSNRWHPEYDTGALITNRSILPITLWTQCSTVTF